MTYSMHHHHHVLHANTRSSSSIDFDREMTLFEAGDDEDAESMVGDGTIGLFVKDMEQMDDDDDDDDDNMGESDETIEEDDSTTTNRDVSKSKGIAKGVSQQQVPVGAKRKKSSDLTPVTKWAIIARHMDELNRASDRLFHGALEEISVAFNVSRRTVQRIVCDYKLQIEKGVRCLLLLTQ
jgi:hypothetical protein